MSTDTVEKKQEYSENQKAETVEKIDFKMVTFSLAGKEYGIDIMNVNSIAHASRFTYVPNAAPFVRGVYNLRGDIISIIDLRTMFHLPAERKSEDAPESLIILRIEDHAIGVIVDEIDKVLGVPASSIQPPHPIFGDINVKYIKGVIENQGKLYIILNVEKLFASRTEEDEEKHVTVSVGAGKSERVESSSYNRTTDVTSDFIRETLPSFRNFHVSPVNEQWFDRRYQEWKQIRKATELQLREQGDADLFLENFYSPCTNELWSDDYANAVMKGLPPIESKTIMVWNPGCGKGYESYSFVCALKKAYPGVKIKVWANDSDLLSISMAPNLVFMTENAPSAYAEYMVKGKNGWTFNQEIRESIYFEFHDIENSNPVPPVDIVLCRDTISFMTVAGQKRLLSDFEDKTKNRAAIIMGKNEVLPLEGWRASSSGSVFIRS